MDDFFLQHLEVAVREAKRQRIVLGRFPGQCVYCGEPEEHRDHLVSRSLATDTVRHLVPTVPACSSCNSLLGDLLQPVISQRARVVAKKLQRRHAKWLTPRFKEWDDDELLGLGEYLAGQILRARHERIVVRRRLEVLGAGGLRLCTRYLIGDLDGD